MTSFFSPFFPTHICTLVTQNSPIPTHTRCFYTLYMFPSYNVLPKSLSPQSFAHPLGPSSNSHYPSIRLLCKYSSNSYCHSSKFCGYNSTQDKVTALTLVMGIEVEDKVCNMWRGSSLNGGQGGSLWDDIWTVSWMIQRYQSQKIWGSIF